MLLLLACELVAALELGELLGGLLGLELVDLDALIVEHRALALGVLGRDVIAVVHDVLVVDPLVGLAVLALGCDDGARAGYESGDEQHGEHRTAKHRAILHEAGGERGAQATP